MLCWQEFNLSDDKLTLAERITMNRKQMNQKLGMQVFHYGTFYYTQQAFLLH